VASAVLFSTGGLLFAQQKNDKQKPPPRWDSPPEVTILEHRFGASRKPVIDTSPDPNSPKGEPSTRVRMSANPAVSLKIKNQTTRKIVGIVWYFVLHKTVNEEYFRVRFVDTSAIEAGKTRTLVGEMETMPMPNPQTRVVTVDELGKPIPPPQEQIVISCIMFADGSFSSLNESTKEDCESLKSIEKRNDIQ
jgi:hypothetical protein